MVWLKNIWHFIIKQYKYVSANTPYSKKFADKVLSNSNLTYKISQHLHNNPGDPLFKINDANESFVIRKVGYVSDEEKKEFERKKNLKELNEKRKNKLRKLKKIK